MTSSGSGIQNKVPLGLIVVYLWIGVGLFHSSPKSNDEDVVMGMTINGIFLSIYWLINKMAILSILLAPVVSNHFIKLKRHIPSLMFIYIGWHALSSLIFSLRILVSSDFHDSMKSKFASGMSAPPDQIIIGLLSLIPALVASLMIYFVYRNRSFFTDKQIENS